MESIRACEAGEILRATQLGRIRRVVEREPLDDERIRRHPRVVLTPHSS